MPIPPELRRHADERRFYADLEDVLATCSVRGAFCVGVLAATGIRTRGGDYAPKKAMQLAAQQDPRAITCWLGRPVKRTRREPTLGTDSALVHAATGAWYLCQSLLAAPGATPELISEVSETLGVAITNAGISLPGRASRNSAPKEGAPER